jgi:DNA mismatch endonuclease, patch repair protein
MVDVLNVTQRSYNMSRIRGKNTSPEIKIRKMLFSEGIRGYRIHYNLPGKPDIVFIKKKIAIFIDGCFWHKCPVCFKEPETRKEFWIEKIDKNVERDLEINKLLKNMGWKVIRIWEHDVRKNPIDVVNMITQYLQDCK